MKNMTSDEKRKRRKKRGVVGDKRIGGREDGTEKEASQIYQLERFKHLQIKLFHSLKTFQGLSEQYFVE